MKMLTRQLMFAVFLTIAAAASADGQIVRQYRAHIPFDFTVNGKEFKAGDYHLGPLNSDSGKPVISLRHRQTGKGRIVGMGTSINSGEARSGHLYFANTEGRYSLLSMKLPSFEMKVRPAKKTDALLVKRNSRIVMIAAN